MTTDTADDYRKHMLRALRIADDALLTLVQTECRVAHHDAAGGGWWDVQPLTDPHEYGAARCDMHRQMLAYGLERQLLLANRQLPHLVRLQPRRTPTL